MAFLVFLKDGRPSLRFRLDNDESTVGRSNEVDIYVPDARVSRLHFIIRRELDGYRLIDRSTNGTYVNRVRSRSTRLKDQDIIDAGSFQLRFELEIDNDPPSTIVAVQESGNVSYDALYERIIFSRPVLWVRDSGAQPARVPVRSEAVGIGSDRRNDVVLTRAADRHVQLLATSDGYTLRNLQPALPPLVNDEPVTHERVLHYGNTIQVAGATLRLVLEEGEEQVAPLDVPRFEGMVGDTPSMHKIFALVDRFARHDAPVIILGETGTGKELVARALHRRGHRCRGPFVAINCSAISPHLFESELFGHEKGAFTGAVQSRIGAIEAAHKGTLFLDELGEMPLELQAKLLRVLETSNVTPVGSHQARPVDVRVVAATHKNMLKAVEEGRFRADLFYRLFVLTIELPPLRDRLADLPALVRHFLDTMGEPDLAARVTPGAMARFHAYRWPGNIRELRHVLTRALAANPRLEVTEQDITFLTPNALPGVTDDLDGPSTVLSLEEMEKRTIEHALRVFEGNRKEASRALGIARSTLHMRLKKYGIDVEDAVETA